MSVTTLQDTIKRLKKYNNSSFLILSIYFHLPVPKLWNNSTITNKLSAVIDRYLSFKERVKAKKDIEYVLGFLQEYQQKKDEASLALFSGGDKLFEIVHLPYKVQNRALLNHSPFLQPLLEEQTPYRKYVVILVDREKAHVFVVSQGIIESALEIADQSVPQNVHASAPEDTHNGRENKINRHIQDHLHKHFQKIVAGVQDFLGNKKVTGVIVGGHRNIFQSFEQQLPKQLQERIVAEMVTELHVSINQLVAKSKKIIDEVDKKLNTQQIPFLLTH